MRNHRTALLVFATVFGACAFFFQGGGWNQNAHFATTMAMVDDRSFVLDNYAESTKDLSRVGSHVVSAKAVGTAIAAIPGYVVAKALTAGMQNRGDRFIVQAYLATLLSTGLALALVAVLLFFILRRRLDGPDAAMLAVAIPLCTPLFPNCTMLNSPSLSALAALLSYHLLERRRLAGATPDGTDLLFSGAAATAAACFEYMNVIVVVPLGLYALWQCRPRWTIAWFAAGAALMAVIPLAHHAAVFGHPLKTGYSSLLRDQFAADASHGFFGFERFSLAALYELTFGSFRGFFFLSPLLVAAIPGTIQLLRDRRTRPEGLVAGAIAWTTMLLVASLVYWHSGAAVGSRYALMFVPFAAILIAAVLPRHRVWIALGAVYGLLAMTMATSVTALPPPPGRPPYENVLGWLWERFARGELPTSQQQVINVAGIGTGGPTLPFAFNLGGLAGLPGLWRLLPFGVFVLSMFGAVTWSSRRDGKG